MRSEIIGCKVSSDNTALILSIIQLAVHRPRVNWKLFISTLPLGAVNQKQSYYTHLLPLRRRPSSQCLGFVILFTR
ncbi:hypothetical protein GHT06_008052 [Daphnia sinensis]|uniref:Uncharacterized protein n=1 Tax=Daphnia sinensis TaxID=1820382 RepID=A0AAD5Q1P5_9CRUS|nr:hypothetical protein GHT06_008052 [Daphnia sinensis]